MSCNNERSIVSAIITYCCTLYSKIQNTRVVLRNADKVYQSMTMFTMIIFLYYILCTMLIYILLLLNQNLKNGANLHAHCWHYVLIIFFALFFLNQKCNVTFQKDIYLYYNILLYKMSTYSSNTDFLPN